MEPTEYNMLADVQKTFEPYCDMWKRVDDWMTWHKGWMNDPFLSLDAEEVTFIAIDVMSSKRRWAILPLKHAGRAFSFIHR